MIEVSLALAKTTLQTLQNNVKDGEEEDEKIEEGVKEYQRSVEDRSPYQLEDEFE